MIAFFLQVVGGLTVGFFGVAFVAGIYEAFFCKPSPGNDCDDDGESCEQRRERWRREALADRRTAINALQLAGGVVGLEVLPEVDDDGSRRLDVLSLCEGQVVLSIDSFSRFGFEASQLFGTPGINYLGRYTCNNYQHLEDTVRKISTMTAKQIELYAEVLDDERLSNYQGDE